MTARDRVAPPDPPAWLREWAGTAQRYDLLILLPNLGRGGSQRVASLLANAWAAAGYRICIGTLSDKAEDAHHLHSGITRLKAREFLRVQMAGRAGAEAATAPTALAPAAGAREAPTEIGPASVPAAGAAVWSATAPSPTAAPSAPPADDAGPPPDGDGAAWLERLRASRRQARRSIRAALFPVREARRAVVRRLRAAKRTLRRRIRAALFPVREARRSVRRGWRDARETGGRWRTETAAGAALRAAALAPVALMASPDHREGAWQAARAIAAAARARRRPLLRTLLEHQDLLADRAKCRQVLAARRLMEHTRAPVVLSFLGSTNLVAALARRGLPCRLVVSERNDPARQQLQPVYERLRPLLYGSADVVTANSVGALAAMGAYVDAAKLRHVPNPLVVPAGQAAPGHAPGRTYITVSRLVPQKRVDLVLRAFAAVVAGGGAPGWRFEVLGDGPERQPLEALAAALGVAGLVTFRGHVDPFPRLRVADVFVLFSDYEGLPNALLEAMACGVAPIVNDGSPGPLEYVAHDRTGLVVASGDVPALAAAMVALARDEVRRRRLAAAAEERVAELALERVLAAWSPVLGLTRSPAPPPVVAEEPRRVAC